MTTKHRSIGRTILITAAGVLLIASAASAAGTAIKVGHAPSARQAAPATPVPLPAPQLSKKRATPIPARPTISTAPHPGGTRDYYCKDNSDTFAACDLAFKTKCENGGGTLSGLQDWGGRTCVEPTG